MSTSVVPISQARMPAKMRERLQAGTALNQNFETGVRDSFPMLSIKGKVFRIRKDGQETPLIDQQTRQVIPYLDVILVNASQTLAKSYYEKGFTEGDFDPPVCWSMDSVRPDPSVANKVNPTCANCPKNAFGSRITDSGKAAKACQDARRIAVMMPGHLGTIDPMVFMLRVPQGSLKNLKAYAQLLERQGWEALACVTRLSFDYNEAFPKLQFNFVDGLTDTEYDQVTGLAQSDTVAAMLSAPDFDAAVSAQTPNASTATTETRVRQEAPVLETVLGTTKTAADVLAAAGVAPRQAASPAPQEATPTAMPEGLIELPDGRYYNPKTGAYVEAPKPPVEATAPRQVDANILALPDGAFFSRTLGVYVDSQYVGAKPIEESKKAPAKGETKAEEPAKRTRRTKAEMEAAKAAEQKPPVQPVQQTQPAPGLDMASILAGATRQAAPQGTDNEGEDPADAKEPTAPNAHAVVSASADLEALLKSVMPS